ncbi:MAG: helix-turn-helix domain-containing protein [Planctomycetes bacterium]|nr:helix-turn-helix domain-containing protein [Planctomycetota bacterium]
MTTETLSPRALTVADAARMLATREPVIRRLIYAGRIRATCLGGWTWRIPLGEIDRLLLEEAETDPRPRRRVPRPGAACGGRPRA